MLQIDIHFDCGGCDAKETVHTSISREFTSFSGRSFGFGTYNLTPSSSKMVKAATPDGWVAFDPYTSCTYCPKCWASIEGEVEGPQPAGEG